MGPQKLNFCFLGFFSLSLFSKASVYPEDQPEECGLVLQAHLSISRGDTLTSCCSYFAHPTAWSLLRLVKKGTVWGESLCEHVYVSFS